MNYGLHHCVAIKVEKKEIIVYLSDVIIVHLISFLKTNPSNSTSTRQWQNNKYQTPDVSQHNDDLIWVGSINQSWRLRFDCLLGTLNLLGEVWMRNHTQKQVKEDCQLCKSAGLHPQSRAVQHKGATNFLQKNVIWFKVSVWETKINVFLVRRIIQYIIQKVQMVDDSRWQSGMWNQTRTSSLLQ